MKKYLILFNLIIGICIGLDAQNVGIGTTEPADKLHIKNGSLQIDGANRYLNLNTPSSHKTGIRFYTNGSFKGGWFYNSQNQILNLSKGTNATGLSFNLNNNVMLVGRNEQITTQEMFGVRANIASATFGGMYMETSGNSGGKPFYGYAIDGQHSAYHYFDGASKTWILHNNGNRFFVKNDGRVGIGTFSPSSNLHINGSNFNLAEGEGILTVGSVTNRLSFGVVTQGSSGLGVGRIYSKGVNNVLILGGGTKDVIAIDGNNKRAGIGKLGPDYTLDVESSETRAIYANNIYSGSSAKYGGRFESNNQGTGTKYGIYGSSAASSNQTTTVYGGRFIATGSQNNGNAYGLYSSVSSAGNGNHFGIYTYASINDPGPLKKSWALYASGNSYFSNNVFIGSTSGVSGYRLSVDGKIICEELKVQLSTDWPDYVFENDYDLKPLKEIEAFVSQNNHLPGVPSAKVIEDQGGIELGEMNRILLEKVEELTLHLINQKNALDIQIEKVNELEKVVNNLKSSKNTKQ